MDNLIGIIEAVRENLAAFLVCRAFALTYKEWMALVELMYRGRLN